MQHPGPPPAHLADEQTGISTNANAIVAGLSVGHKPRTSGYRAWGVDLTADAGRAVQDPIGG